MPLSFLKIVAGLATQCSVKEKSKRWVQLRIEVGDIEASRKGIAGTFPKIYEDLHSSSNNERNDEKDSDGRLENNCDHADDDEKIEDDEQDNHMP